MTEHTTEPEPDRQEFLSYGRQSIEESDVDAVVKVLRSDWLTTGPNVAEFEKKFAEAVGAEEAVALSNGTAALHAMTAALDLGPGDEVIVPAMTFAATANSVVFEGATPVFCDVKPGSLLIDEDQAQRLVTPKTRAIVAVDYAGHPCDYDRLDQLAKDYQIALLSDACHSLGATYKGRPVGSQARMNAFSFHPVKNITTGEGGMVTTDNEELADRIRRFRNHGISRDHQARKEQKTHRYDMVELGYNYRLTDIQCALGTSQLERLPDFVDKRRKIAREYDRLLADVDSIKPLDVSSWAEPAYHLYVVKIEGGSAEIRDQVFSKMHESGIGVNVHYLPVHLHSFYRKTMGTGEGSCPVAEEKYDQILSLPIYPTMTYEDIHRVVSTLTQAIPPREVQ